MRRFAGSLDLGPERLLRAIPAPLFAFTGALMLLAAFLALTVPYHSWDALAHSEWSRHIADGRFHAPELSDLHYQRPLLGRDAGLPGSS